MVAAHGAEFTLGCFSLSFCRSLSLHLSVSLCPSALSLCAHIANVTQDCQSKAAATTSTAQRL